MTTTITKDQAVAELTRRALPKEQRTAAMREAASTTGAIMLTGAELKKIAGIEDTKKAKTTKAPKATQAPAKAKRKPAPKSELGELSAKQIEAAKAFRKAFRIEGMPQAVSAYARVMRSNKFQA